MPLIFLVLVSALVARDQAPAPADAGAIPPAAALTIASARADLETMHDTDQSYRVKLIEIEKQHGRDSAEAKEAWAKQSAIDAENIRRLEAIIAQFGWPGITQFGDKAARSAFLILQHSGLEYQKKYLSIAREAAAKAELRPSQFALLEDRVRLREGQKQIYGSQVQRNAAGDWEPLPIEDEQKVHALRASVGLNPLSEYLQSFADRSGGHVNPKWGKKSDAMADQTQEPKSAAPVSGH